MISVHTTVRARASSRAMERRIWANLAALLAVGACGDGGDGAGGGDAAGPGDGGGAAGWTAAPALPEPVANNALAALDDGDGCVLLSALGIDETRTVGGITARARTWRVGEDAWTALPDVPVASPLIAASAVAVDGAFYVLGGYSVSGGGAEASSSAVFVWRPGGDQWEETAPLPTPIDDAVAVAWRDRWIVVVSGWSDTAPVADVQIYDTGADEWIAATQFPGTPVFGHAGAIVGDDLVVVDGAGEGGAGGFTLVSQVWGAALDADDPATIVWTELAAHPGPARYRAAAGELGGRLHVHGGTDDPYNFDGLSYDAGQPAPPLAGSISFDPASGAWSTTELPDKTPATMDHRALASCGGALYTAGGMIAGPAVTASVLAVRP